MLNTARKRGPAQSGRDLLFVASYVIGREEEVTDHSGIARIQLLEGARR